jgi:hypothetical protein
MRAEPTEIITICANFKGKDLGKKEGNKQKQVGSWERKTNKRTRKPTRCGKASQTRAPRVLPRESATMDAREQEIQLRLPQWWESQAAAWGAWTRDREVH